MKKSFQFLAVMASLACLTSTAFAQADTAAFPTKTVHLITLTTPGGSLDVLARVIAQNLNGMQVVVENKVGAGGNIGAEALARSKPDGYTIGMVTSSTHGINPSLYGSKMPFDPVKDFAPITVAAELKNVVVVNPSLPVKNIPELVAHLRANPDKVSFGSAGVGTSQHLAGEMFKLMTKTQMTHVPYRGAAAAVPDLLSNQIQMMFVSIPDVIGHIEAGRLRAIGVTSKSRAASLPDVVPVAEQGYPEFDVRGWFGVAAPAGTPPAIVDRFNKEIVAALTKADVQERLKTLGMDPVTSTPKEFEEHIKAEVAKWAPVVKESGATIN